MPITLSLSGISGSDATVIPNLFFDNYMPKADGDFIKIYLYLYRHMPFDHISISLSSMADLFDLTEKAVMRALRYWEEEGLLTLILDQHSELSGIIMLPIQKTEEPVTATTSVADDYPMEKIEQFFSCEKGQELRLTIQSYLNHPLTYEECDTIFFFHSDLDFSYPLIEYLFEYCASHEHRDINYIKAVALEWGNNQIQTIDQARQYTSAYHQANYAILKAFGIANRSIAPVEQEFIQKWLNEYKFSIDIICEACNRTILKTHNASFDYADKILTTWKNQHLYTMREIKEADQNFMAAKTQPAQTAKHTYSTSKPATNRFNQFNQRQYDYAFLEEKLSTKNIPSGQNSTH